VSAAPAAELEGFLPDDAPRQQPERQQRAVYIPNDAPLKDRVQLFYLNRHQ
jgi:hypothetical protein